MGSRRCTHSLAPSESVHGLSLHGIRRVHEDRSARCLHGDLRVITVLDGSPSSRGERLRTRESIPVWRPWLLLYWSQRVCSRRMARGAGQLTCRGRGDHALLRRRRKSWDETRVAAAPTDARRISRESQRLHPSAIAYPLLGCIIMVTITSA